MERDLGKIKKNPETEIVVRIDDFGGKSGLTIREFVTSANYTGFTKSGTRIPAENFEEFKEMINSISPSDLKASASEAPKQNSKPVPKTNSKPKKEQEETEEDLSGIDEDGLM
jgi:hypothetical protein